MHAMAMQQDPNLEVPSPIYPICKAYGNLPTTNGLKDATVPPFQDPEIPIDMITPIIMN